MSTGDSFTIFCLVHTEAENAGLQELENGANGPQNQRSTERYQFLSVQMSAEFLVEPAILHSHITYDIPLHSVINFPIISLG